MMVSTTAAPAALRSCQRAAEIVVQDRKWHAPVSSV